MNYPTKNITFLYALRKKDKKHKTIRKILGLGRKYANDSTTNTITMTDIYRKDPEHIMDVIVDAYRADNFVILCGHGNGYLNFRIGKKNDNVTHVSFNANPANANGELELSQSVEYLLPRLNEKLEQLNIDKQLNLLVISCHFGQLKGIDFSLSTTKIRFWYLDPEYTISFKNGLALIESLILKRDSVDPEIKLKMFVIKIRLYSQIHQVLNITMQKCKKKRNEDWMVQIKRNQKMIAAF